MQGAQKKSFPFVPLFIGVMLCFIPILKSKDGGKTEDQATITRPSQTSNGTLDAIRNIDVNGVNIVCKARHYFTRRVRVEISDRKLLKLVEKVVSYLFNRTLRDGKHKP